MKRNPGLIALFFAVFCFYADANTRSEEERAIQDSAIVYTIDGEVHAGRIADYWTKWKADGFNKKFTLDTGDRSKSEFDTETLDSILFPLRTDGWLKVYRPYKVACPKIGKKDNVEVYISGEGARSAHARIVIPNHRVSVTAGMNTMHARWKVVQMPCLKMENDSVAYPFIFPMEGGFSLRILKYCLSKSDPALYKHIEQWFKADKKRKKDVIERWSLMLDAVEEYYDSQSDTSDN